jgi:uncharacterized protein
MSGPLPSRINPFRLAEQGAIIRGAIPLAHMRRLGGLLMSPNGEVQVSLAFGAAAGRHVVEGHLDATLQLQCQRCLHPVAKTVDRRFRLVMVHGDREAALLQTDHEILEVEDELLPVRTFIEDELLLSAPLIPMHDDATQCDAAMLERLGKHADRAVSGDPQNPFAALKDLKRS